MTIAVTAASGQLGGEIVRALLTLGVDSVVGLARTPSKASALGIEVRKGDYSSPKDLRDSTEGVTSLLLVSGMDAPDRRVEQHRNVIRAAIAAGVRKIVYTSVQGAEEGNAFSPVVQSNRQTERDVRESGLDWTIGRNGIYIEPDVEYIDTYRAAGVITKLGEFLGTVIAGIYEGIACGVFDNPSHFEKAAGREHQSWKSFFAGIARQ